MTDKTKKKKTRKKNCVICKKKIKPDPNGWDGGHNAEPVRHGRCCGYCNDLVITPYRIAEFYAHQKKREMKQIRKENNVKL